MTTKENIIAAAQNLFAAFGYAGTTVDDIVTASGVTKGAFYHYFKTKPALCEAVISNIENNFQQIFRTFDNEPDEFKRLEKTVAAFIELAKSASGTELRAALRISMDIEMPADKAKQKKLDLWQRYKNEFAELVKKCRQAEKIDTSTDLQTQIDVITTLLAGFTANNSCCGYADGKKTAEYILSKLQIR